MSKRTQPQTQDATRAVGTLHQNHIPQFRLGQPPPIFTSRRYMRTRRTSGAHNTTPILRRSRRTTSPHPGVGDAAPTTKRSSLNRSILVIVSFQPNDPSSIRPRSSPNIKTPAASQPNAGIPTNYQFARLVQAERFQAFSRSSLFTFKQPLNDRRSVLDTPPSRQTLVPEQRAPHPVQP